jgi:hypothetical protein
VGGDFQLVEQRFVVQAVGGKAVQIDHPCGESQILLAKLAR